MADPEALFFSDNFLTIVDPDHENFIDLSTFGRIICEADVVIDRDRVIGVHPRRISGRRGCAVNLNRSRHGDFDPDRSPSARRPSSASRECPRGSSAR
ncbi:hypothetical protein [Goodfellowiella coeruleoviolacea]|uniref:Uncharacterized protein n=1 Tax=Goodfellowiella coeruleoviolacea TaxID=334858 RepID=A0AAE3KI61_9PSEU|nr:hypothetical protein [Goodfellowiella coeruleoviolacea]MCP2167089.1 hypothetical protein [Goodfellowiella coeruleoviolacea]